MYYYYDNYPLLPFVCSCHCDVLTRLWCCCVGSWIEILSEYMGTAVQGVAVALVVVVVEVLVLPEFDSIHSKVLQL